MSLEKMLETMFDYKNVELKVTISHENIPLYSIYLGKNKRTIKLNDLQNQTVKVYNSLEEAKLEIHELIKDL